MCPDDSVVRHSHRLRNELGLALLAYVLNRSEKQIEARLAGGRRLGREPEGVLGEIIAAVTLLERESHADSDDGRPSVLARILASYNENRGMSAANALRSDCGGELPQVRKTADTARNQLEVLARDAYPATLLPSGGPPTPFGSLSGMLPVLFGHQARPLFEAAVLADNQLARLFSSSSEQSGHAGSYYTNLGYGSSLQLWTLAEGLISAAEVGLSLDGELTPNNLVRRTADNLDKLRILVDGGSVRVKARIGLVGIDLDGNHQVETPWGMLRRPTTEERERIGMLGATSGDAVFEVSAKMRLYLGPGASPEGSVDPTPLMEVSQGFHEDLNDRVTKLGLAVLMAVERERPLAPIRSWTMLDDVLRSGAGLSWSRLAFALPSEKLGPGDRRRLRLWADRVKEHYHRSITVGVQRALAAVTHRLDPADGLIDAVIALENLFGTTSPQGELTFRVSAACACLLEDDPALRRERRKKVADVYRERSNIVHGNTPGPRVSQHRDAAVILVRETLRSLFRDRPELLPDRDRSIDLILNP